MKQLLKRILGERALTRIRRLENRRQLRAEFAADRRRFERYMLPADHQVTKDLRGRNLEAQLTKDYHRVEKGLALADPRRPFGGAVLDRLDGLIPTAKAIAPGAAYLSHAVSARSALVEWNSGGAIADDVSPAVSPTDRGLPHPEQFFSTRHSVRDFDDRPVAQELLDRAVQMAVATPSVCNRQAWHVRFFHQVEAVSVLRFQNGSAGFAQDVPVVALVTVDSRMFAGAGERNQGWIEGGLFSMTFVWALHGLGLDACMLNMSLTNGEIAALRDALAIPENELVIMMIAIGYGRAGHRRARSPRRTVSDVILPAQQF